MIKSILFTKKIDSTKIDSFLGNSIHFDIHNFLQIEFTNHAIIQKQINLKTKINLISSQNAVKAIENLEINGDFFVVGKKTAEALKMQNRKILAVENYAKDLYQNHLINLKSTEIQFFCGDNRRDFLVEKLTQDQHQLTEIIAYQSIPNPIEINKIYDAYVFFSPLSFNTFLEKNTIREDKIIFSIGETTTNHIRTKIKNNIITAKEPLVEAVLEEIKRYQDDKK